LGDKNSGQEKYKRNRTVRDYGIDNMTAPNEPRINSFKKVFPSIVKVQTSHGSGTGFLTNLLHRFLPDVLSIGITCNHVVQKQEGTVYVVIPGNNMYTPFRFLVVSRLPYCDLAFIGIVTSHIDLRGFAPNLSQKSPYDLFGEEVGTLGFPDVADIQAHPSALRGIVSSIVDYQWLKLIQTDIMVHPGCSGGPLFLTSTGEVVGVVASRDVRKQFFGQVEVPTNFSFAIPINYVIDSLMQSRPSSSFRSNLENLMKQG